MVGGWVVRGRGWGGSGGADNNNNSGTSLGGVLLLLLLSSLLLLLSSVLSIYLSIYRSLSSLPSHTEREPGKNSWTRYLGVCGNASHELGDVGGRSGESSLFFLTVSFSYHPGIGSPGDRVGRLEEHPAFWGVRCTATSIDP